MPSDGRAIRLKGVIVNRVKTRDGIKCEVFCKHLKELVVMKFDNYEVGSICEFTTTSDGNIQDIQKIRTSRNLEYEVENLQLEENWDDTTLPFNLVGQDDVFGPILVPASTHTMAGKRVRVIVSFNTFMDMKYKWYAIKVYDTKSKSFTSILGSSSPLSVLSRTLAEDEVDLNSVAISSSDTEETYYYQAPKSVEESTYNDNYVRYENYNRRDLSYVGIKHVPEAVNFFSNEMVPCMQFKSLPKLRPELVETCNDIVIFLARCPEFAVVLSAHNKEFGIMFPTHESYQFACPGNVSRCVVLLPRNGNIEGVYKFVVENVGTFISNWKLRSVLNVSDDTVSLSVSVALTDKDIAASDNDITFPFGVVNLDRKLHDCYDNGERFAFRATLLGYDSSKEKDKRLMWQCHYSSYIPLS